MAQGGTHMLKVMNMKSLRKNKVHDHEIEVPVELDFKEEISEEEEDLDEISEEQK